MFCASSALGEELELFNHSKMPYKVNKKFCDRIHFVMKYTFDTAYSEDALILVANIILFIVEDIIFNIKQKVIIKTKSKNKK